MSYSFLKSGETHWNYFTYLKMLPLFYPNKKEYQYKYQYNLETMICDLPIVLKFLLGIFWTIAVLYYTTSTSIILMHNNFFLVQVLGNRNFHQFLMFFVIMKIITCVILIFAHVNTNYGGIWRQRKFRFGLEDLRRVYTEAILHL